MRFFLAELGFFQQMLFEFIDFNDDLVFSSQLTDLDDQVEGVNDINQEHAVEESDKE